MIAPFSTDIGKTEAVKRLAAFHGVGDINPWSETIDESLTFLLERGGPSNAMAAKLISARDAGQEKHLFDASARRLERPLHLSERPGCFPEAGGDVAFSPELKTLSIPNGLLWNFAHSAVVFGADRQSIVGEYSTKYAQLVHFYDMEAVAPIAAARHIDGTAIVMMDDIWPLNFCHWLVDWLPRLAAFGPRTRRSDHYVITIPLTSSFQLETLQMCGFGRDRIIEVENFHAVSARELVVTSDLKKIPHPTLKAAPWALAYLQSTVGLRSVLAHRGRARGIRRSCISRARMPRVGGW